MIAGSPDSIFNSFSQNSFIHFACWCRNAVKALALWMLMHFQLFLLENLIYSNDIWKLCKCRCQSLAKPKDTPMHVYSKVNTIVFNGSYSQVNRDRIQPQTQSQVIAPSCKRPTLPRPWPLKNLRPLRLKKKKSQEFWTGTLFWFFWSLLALLILNGLLNLSYVILKFCFMLTWY